MLESKDMVPLYIGNRSNLNPVFDIFLRRATVTKFTSGNQDFTIIYNEEIQKLLEIIIYLVSHVDMLNSVLSDMGIEYRENCISFVSETLRRSAPATISNNKK